MLNDLHASTDPAIKTDRLILRPFEKTDLDGVEAYFSLSDVQRYLDWKARDRREARAALEAMRRQTRLTRPGDSLALACVRKADGRVIGHVALRWTDATAAQAEISFALAPAFRRKGYATEAVRAVVGLGFEEMRFHRIFARTAAANEGAARLLRDIGMRLEAHYREHALFQGEWDEELHFAVLDREWRRGAKVQEITRHLVA